MIQGAIKLPLSSHKYAFELRLITNEEVNHLFGYLPKMTNPTNKLSVTVVKVVNF